MSGHAAPPSPSPDACQIMTKTKFKVHTRPELTHVTSFTCEPLDSSTFDSDMKAHRRFYQACLRQSTWDENTKRMSQLSHSGKRCVNGLCLHRNSAHQWLGIRFDTSPTPGHVTQVLLVLKRAATPRFPPERQRGGECFPCARWPTFAPPLSEGQLPAPKRWLCHWTETSELQSHFCSDKSACILRRNLIGIFRLWSAGQGWTAGAHFAPSFYWLVW